MGETRKERQKGGGNVAGEMGKTSTPTPPPPYLLESRGVPHRLRPLSGQWRIKGHRPQTKAASGQLNAKAIDLCLGVAQALAPRLSTSGMYSLAEHFRNLAVSDTPTPSGEAKGGNPSGELHDLRRKYLDMNARKEQVARQADEYLKQLQQAEALAGRSHPPAPPGA